MASLIHEVYHHDWPEDFDLLKSLKLKQCLYTDLLNITTDHNIERHRDGEYVGRDKRMLKDRDYVSNQFNRKSEGQPPLTGDAAVASAVAAWDNDLRMDWQGNHVPIRCDGEAEELRQKLHANKELCEQYVQARDGGQPNKDMTDAILAALDMKDSDATNGQGGTDPESCEERGKQQGKGKGEEGKGKGQKGQGKGEEGEGEAEGQGQGEGGEGDKLRQEEALVKWREDMGIHDHEHHGQPRGNLTIDYSDYESSGNYQPSDNKIVRQAESDPNPHRKQDIMEVLENAGDLPRRVRNELKIASVTRREHGRKSGRIDRKKISKIATKSKSEALFVRRGAPKDVLDTAAFLLVDCSGSMGGDKYDHAAAGAVMLHRCFDALKMPVSIGAFTNQGHTPLFYHFQQFGERVSEDVLLDRMSSVNMSSNPDGEAVMWASDQLLQRKEKRKLLVVLSDGQPAFRGDDVEFLKRVVKQVEEESPIDLIGIGIKDRSVKEYYTNHLVVQRSNELESTILNVIKRNLLK
jgi:cobalamin biosynthesis protein CobT